MTLKKVGDDFRRMGLSENEIHRSLKGMGMLVEDSEMDVDDDFEEEEDFEDSYIDDDDDSDDEEDELGEGSRTMRTKKTSAAGKRKSKQYYKSHKSQVKRQRKKFAKSSTGKRHAKMRKAKPSTGRPHTRRVFSDVETPDEGGMQESILGDLQELAESIDRDPKSRFDEYVEAFNYIADLGELLALRSITEDEDEESATEVIGLSVHAEDVLKEMEEMGGALTPEEDAELEATLDEALEEVEMVLEAYGLIAEDEEYDEEEHEEEEYDEEEYEEDGLEESALDDTIASLEEAARNAKRPTKASAKGGRKTLHLGKPKVVKGASSWGKKHGKGAAKKQLMGRKDVRSKEALLNYLKLVKSGQVAPGQKTPASVKKARAGKGKMDKKGRWNPGAAAAKKAAGK